MKKLFVALMAALLPTAALMAAETLSTDRLQFTLPNGTSAQLEWRQVPSSFDAQDIHTYMGYKGSRLVATVSTTPSGELSGWYYDRNGVATQLSATAGGTLRLTDKSVSQQAELSCDTDAAAEVSPLSHISRSPVIEGDSPVLKGQPLNYNDDKIHVYRTAIAISNYAYKWYCNSKMEQVKVFWAQVEAQLNQYLGRQCGIYFKVIDDERLVVTDASVSIPGSVSGSTIINNSYLNFTKLIDADSYDFGVMVTEIEDSNGLSKYEGAYQSALCAASTAIGTPVVIAHEAIHMFGSYHTNSDENYNTYRSEPGVGTSAMASGQYASWISLMSINRIRHASIGYNMPYYLYPDRTTLIETEKNVPSVSQYNNYVGALLSDNRPPVIDRTNLKEEYTIPHGTYFQFQIDATDPDGDEMEYAAQQVSYFGSSTAQFRVAEPTSSSLVCFQPQYEYDWLDRQWSKLDYTDVDVTGSYWFWVAVNDLSPDPDNFLEHPHAVGYDIQEVVVNFVDGTPFRLTNKKATSYTAGQRLTLNWDVDTNVFGADSQVRILMSDDFGETWKYVLKEHAPNNGSCEVILPNTSFSQVEFKETGRKIRAGIIKVEVIGSIAYAVTEASPVIAGYNNDFYEDGGFSLAASKISFTNTPERYVVVASAEDVPEKSDVKAYSGGKEVAVTYTETTDDDVISRVWEASDGTNTAAFEQIVVVKPSTLTTDPETPGETTRLRETSLDTPTSSAVYDLQGRRVRTPHRGQLTIENGRLKKN